MFISPDKRETPIQILKGHCLQLPILFKMNATLIFCEQAIIAFVSKNSKIQFYIKEKFG